MHPVQVKIFQSMTPAQKLEIAGQYCAAARELKTRALRQQHPDWSDARVQQEVKRLFIHAAS